MAKKRILLAGESWIMHTIHQKGFDSFTTTAYGEGHQWLSAALTGAGFEVIHLPNHLADAQFPLTAVEMEQYDAIILSDIGSNTLLIHPDTFTKGTTFPNRLEELCLYVEEGGGLVMVGGYLSFSGIEGKARYYGSPLVAALPVTINAPDDRVELPQGAAPKVVDSQHPIVKGLPNVWPQLLGYNRVDLKTSAKQVATVNGELLIGCWNYKKGRSAVFTSDCGPHWAPTEFVEWEGYAPLWAQLVDWVTGS